MLSQSDLNVTHAQERSACLFERFSGDSERCPEFYPVPPPQKYNGLFQSDMSRLLLGEGKA